MNDNKKKTKRNERNRVRGVDGRPARCVTTAFKNRSIIRRDNRYVGPKEKERETEGEGQVTWSVRSTSGMPHAPTSSQPVHRLICIPDDDRHYPHLHTYRQSTARWRRRRRRRRRLSPRAPHTLRPGSSTEFYWVYYFFFFFTGFWWNTLLLLYLTLLGFWQLNLDWFSRWLAIIFDIISKVVHVTCSALDVPLDFPWNSLSKLGFVGRTY